MASKVFAEKVFKYTKFFKKFLFTTFVFFFSLVLFVFIHKGHHFLRQVQHPGHRGLQLHLPQLQQT